MAGIFQQTVFGDIVQDVQSGLVAHQVKQAGKPQPDQKG